MSHITSFMQDHIALALTNPRDQHKKRCRESDFHRTKEALGTPKRFRTAETPRARKINFEADLVATIEEQEIVDSCKSISGRWWKVYHVSPLFNFVSEQRDDLNQLENFLESRLDAEIGDWRLRSFKGSDKNTAWNVRVKVLRGLRGHRDDGEALKLSVILPTTVRKKKMEKTVMTAYFVAVDSSDFSDMSDKTMMSNLPCCLVSGDSEVTRVILKSLETRFDCIMGRVHFNDQHLKWMSAMWMGFAAEAETDGVEEVMESEVSVAKRGKENATDPEVALNNTLADTLLPSDPSVINNPGKEGADRLIQNENKCYLMYDVTKSFPTLAKCGIDQMAVKLDAHTMRRMWHGFFGCNLSQVAEEDVDEFHLLIEGQLRKEFQINMEKLRLSRISLPSFQCKDIGLIRIERYDKVKTVLSYLTDICQGTISSPYPRLSTAEISMISE